MTNNNTAKPIAFKPLSDKSLANKYADRVRHGKTKKDKAKRHHQEPTNANESG